MNKVKDTGLSVTFVDRDYGVGFRDGGEWAAALCESMPTADIADFAGGNRNVAELTAKLCAQRIRDALRSARAGSSGEQG